MLNIAVNDFVVKKENLLIVFEFAVIGTNLERVAEALEQTDVLVLQTLRELQEPSNRPM